MTTLTIVVVVLVVGFVFLVLGVFLRKPVVVLVDFEYGRIHRLTLHKWAVKYNTGKYEYVECSKCGQRGYVCIDWSGHQPLHKFWLLGGSWHVPWEDEYCPSAKQGK